MYKIPMTSVLCVNTRRKPWWLQFCVGCRHSIFFKEQGLISTGFQFDAQVYMSVVLISVIPLGKALQANSSI